MTWLGIVLDIQKKEVLRTRNNGAIARKITHLGATDFLLSADCQEVFGHDNPSASNDIKNIHK